MHICLQGSLMLPRTPVLVMASSCQYSYDKEVHRTWLKYFRLLHTWRFPHVLVKVSFFTGASLHISEHRERGWGENREEKQHHLVSTSRQPNTLHVHCLSLFSQEPVKVQPFPKYKWGKGAWNLCFPHMTVQNGHQDNRPKGNFVQQNVYPINAGTPALSSPHNSDDQDTLEHSE